MFRSLITLSIGALAMMPAAADQLVLVPLSIDASDAELSRLADQVGAELASDSGVRRVAGPKERLGAMFVGADVLAKLAEQHAATHVVTGSLERVAAKSAKITIQISLWRVSPAERIATFSEKVATTAVIEAAKKARLEMMKPLALGPPAPIAPEPEASRAVVLAGAEVAKIDVVRDTENIPARVLIIGGSAAVVASVLVGAGSHLFFGAPLNDGMVRSGAGAGDLLSASKSGAIIADVGLIAGAAVAVAGGVLWLVGAGETEVQP